MAYRMAYLKIGKHANISFGFLSHTQDPWPTEYS